MTRRIDFSDIETGCCVPGWDGYGGTPISPETIAQAKRFIDALPEEIPTPDIAGEADGDIGFEWYKSPRRLLSVSISAAGVLAYAGLLGDAGSASGTEQFVDEIPVNIANLALFVMLDKPLQQEAKGE